VFRILQRSAAIAGVASLAWAAFVTPAIAVTYLPSQTFKAGTRIACVLEESVTSATAKYGDQFKLRVADPAHPALEGSVIHGYITDVRQPAGLNRARIGFWLTSIHLRNGKSKPISATVLSRRVVQINPAAQRAVTQQLPPSQPYGTVTPGPIAWEMRIGGGGKPSISSHSSPSLGGYVYGTSAHEPIVIPAGVSVTVELQSDLTIP
jgi:hypothetical protein